MKERQKKWVNRNSREILMIVKQQNLMRLTWDTGDLHSIQQLFTLIENYHAHHLILTDWTGVYFKLQCSKSFLFLFYWFSAK